MKKILAWVLLFVMVMGMFAGCGSNEEETPAPTETETPSGEVITAQDAIEYLKALYPKGEEALKTPVNYDRMGIIRVGGIPFTVVWTTDLPEEQIKVVVSEDGATVTMDVNEQCEVDTPYVLTATITDEQGNTASTTWNCLLPEAVDMVSLVKEAYALKPGESLPYVATLRGKIVSIDTVWNPEYQNITVTIAVEGAEDMPVQCYRLKGEGADALAVGNIITVTGTLKNYNGTIEFDAGCMLDAVEQGDAVVAPTDPGEILKAAYKLKDGKSLPYPVTLTGKVTSIDSPFDPAYSNISVVLTVDGYKKYPILCYRLKGAGVEDIALEDTITVTGIIKNYKGTIEFDAGCQLIERISGGNTAQKPTDDEAKILRDAKKLKPGEKLPYIAILTGQVFSVDTPYDSEYQNITVTIKVSGTRIQCYRMKGDDVKKVKVSDTITVSGQIENYNGILEYSQPVMTDRKAGNGKLKVELGPLEEGKLYYAEMKQNTLHKNLYLNGQISGSGYLKTTDNAAQAVQIQVEEESGKGTRFYFMEGETKKYIEIHSVDVSGETKQRPAIVTEPTNYWNYDSEYKVYFMSADGVYCALGTYSNYDTVSATKLSFLSTSNMGKTQFVVKYVTEPSEAPEVPEEPEQGVIFVDAPAVGTAYKFVLDQAGLGQKLGFTGKMSGFYYGTSETLTDMVDVYLEEATGGYHIYFMNGNTKTYLNVIPRDNDATKTNVVLQTLAQNAAPSVYELNTEFKYVKTAAVGDEWYLGTYGTNKTISASQTYRIEDTTLIGVSQFVAWFATIGEVTPDTPVDPEDPPVEPEEPVTGVTELVTGDQVVIFAPAYNKALSVNKAGNYNAGVDIRVENGTVTNYGATETFTVTVNPDGTYSFANNGQNLGMADQYTSMNLGAVNDKWELTSLEGTLYNIKNTVRGTYMEWYVQYSNWSTYGANNAATDDQFQLSIYVIGKGLLGVASSEPEQPEQPETPATNAIKMNDLPVDGDVVVIYNSGKAMGNTASGSKIAAVDGTVTDDVLALSDEMAQLKVVVEGNNYIFMLGDKYLTSGATGNAMSFADTLTDCGRWTIEAATAGTWYIKNVGANYNGNYNQAMEYYSGFTTYGLRETEIYQMQLFKVDATPAAPTGAGKMNDLPVNDDVVVIYNSGKAMGNTASGSKIAAVDATVTDDVLTLSDEMAQLKVVVEGNNYIFMLGDKYLTSGATGNAMSFADTLTDCGRWTIEAATAGTWYIKNVGANYNGNYNQAMEYYSGFTTYGLRETEIYQMQLYKVGAAVAPEQPPVTPDQPPVTPDEPVTPPATADGILELTVDTLSLASNSYSSGTATVEGIALDYTQLGNYGDGLQMRDKNGNTSILFNTTALPGKITKIELTYSTTKDVTHSNADAVIFSFGAAQDNLTYSTKLSTVAGEKNYTITPEGEHTFFKIEHDLGFSFYWDSIKVYYEATSTEPETPPVNPEQPSTGVSALTTGDQVVIFAPAYNKALSVNKAGNYNAGVDIRVENGAVTNYGATETFTVTVNPDGTYSFANNGQNLGMADQYTSMNLGAVNDKWELTSLEGTLYNIKNTVRGTYMEWYVQYSNWSTYGANNAATDDQFQLSIYVIGKGLLGVVSGEPDQPPVTPDEPVTPPATADGILELTVDTLGLASNSYSSGTATVEGIALDYTQLGNYGDGIQMRDKNGNTSILFNTTALPGKITKIELVFNSSKTTYNNADAVIFSFGAAQDNLTYSTKLSTVAGEKNYTITPEGEHTFFKIEHDLGFSFFWDSIKVYYEATSTEPETPPAGNGGSADFNTIQLPAAKPNGDSSYTATYNTANGWVTTNSAIQCGGSADMNPQFTVIGADNTFKAVCLNGKVGAAGKITSPTLTGGISKLTVRFTKMFTDTQLSATVTITDLATNQKYTFVISRTLDKNEKFVVYTDELILDAPIAGDFTIEIENNCPTGATGNKDRMTILSIEW